VRACVRAGEVKGPCQAAVLTASCVCLTLARAVSAVINSLHQLKDFVCIYIYIWEAFKQLQSYLKSSWVINRFDAESKTDVSGLCLTVSLIMVTQPVCATVFFDSKFTHLISR
jgi:hypothetical protein